MSTEFRLAPTLRHLCRAMQGLVVIGVLAAIWFAVFENGIGAIADHYYNDLDEAPREAVVFTPLKSALVNTIAALSFFSPLLILYGVWRVFGTFAKGPVISTMSVRTIRLLGWLIIARVIASVLTLPAMTIALTYDNPDELGMLSVALGTHQIQSLLFGVLFIMIGHVLTKAVELAEENGEFV